MDDKTKVLDAMKRAGKPVRAGDLAEATGMDKAVVSKAMDILKKEGSIQSPKKCFWEPKA